MFLDQRKLSIGQAVALCSLLLAAGRALAAEGAATTAATAEVAIGETTQQAPEVKDDAKQQYDPKQQKTGGPQNMISTTPVAPEDAKPPRAPGVVLVKEGRLKERVHARWDAAMKGDFEKAYAFETPASREAESLEAFSFRLGRARSRWHLASLKELRYDQPDKAEAVIMIEYSFATDGGGTIVRTSGNFPDSWVFLDGDWWRQPTNARLGARPQLESTPRSIPPPNSLLQSPKKSSPQS